MAGIEHDLDFSPLSAFLHHYWEHLLAIQQITKTQEQLHYETMLKGSDGEKNDM